MKSALRMVAVILVFIWIPTSFAGEEKNTEDAEKSAVKKAGSNLFELRGGAGYFSRAVFVRLSPYGSSGSILFCGEKP